MNFCLVLSLILIPLLALLIGDFVRLDADFQTYHAPAPKEGFYQDKVVWITGASSGIGAYLAKDLARRGAQLVLSGRRVEELNKVADSLIGAEGYTAAEEGFQPARRKALVLPFDMLDTAYHGQAVQTVLDHFNKIDILVLNAGRTQRSVVWETDPSTVRTITELNYLSLVSLAQLNLPHFLSRQRGHFVITSSFSGLLATPLSATYAGSKFALHGFFNSLRAEVAGPSSNIKVTIACPGPVVSEIGKSAIVTNAGTNYNIQSSEKRMSTERCAYLMSKGIAAGLEELWICQQPLLVLYYLGQYLPNLYRHFIKILGPARVGVFKEGGDDYDLKQVLMYSRRSSSQWT